VDVCELCTLQARESGWRPADEQPPRAEPASARERRRSGALGRLRAALGDRLGAQTAAGERPAERPGRARARRWRRRERADRQGAETLRPAAAQAPAASVVGSSRPASAGNELAAALDLFNQTAETQRIAGVARTLGAPLVTIRAAPAQGAGADGGAGRFILTAAWEISWYRWELDLQVAALDAQLLASGHDPEELSAEELVGNCRADQRGRLMLVEG